MHLWHMDGFSRPMRWLSTTGGKEGEGRHSGVLRLKEIGEKRRLAKEIRKICQ